MTFPVVVLLIDRHRRHPFTRRTLAETAPFFFLSAGAGVLILIAQQPALRIGSAETPLWDGPFIAAHGVLRYLAATLLPMRLSPVYPYPERLAGLLPWPYLLALPAVLALLVLLWRQRLIRPLLFTSGALFLVMLAPVLQLVPIGFIEAADRYTYLPSMGFAWPLARGIGCGFSRFTGKARATLVVGIVIAAVACGAGTARYVSVWRNSLTLWDRVTELYPRSFMAWYFRGAALHDLGRWDEAMTDYQRALDLTTPLSRTVMIHHNIGNLLSRGTQNSPSVGTQISPTPWL